MRSIEKENKRLKDILPKNFARPELDKRRLGDVVDLFTNIQMHEILENWIDEEIVQMMKQFSSYSIFGLTALGGVPKLNKISSSEIRPRRVLDPLLWILAENKYIKTIK